MQAIKNNNKIIKSNKQKMKSFTVGSLYAGIGGICKGFELAGAEIVWANEWDKQACLTYRNNFKHILYEGDVAHIEPMSTPRVDILTSGFPCQAFSVAGRRLGFKDERGLHFFQTIKFLDVKKEHQPGAFLFENVKNIKTHDFGNTFTRIEQEIKRRDYSFVSLVLNTMNYGNVPQTRERVFMVGFKGESGWVKGDGSRTDYFMQNAPTPVTLSKGIQDMLDEHVDDRYYYQSFACHGSLKATIKKMNTIYQWRRKYVRENKSNVCPTLTANMGTGGHNVPLILDKKGIRKLTPRECARFQGFKDKDLVFPNQMADSHKYKQIGNSVSVPVVRALAKAMLCALEMGGSARHVRKYAA